MHTENLELWRHEHVFDTHDGAAERGTRAVMSITALMMTVEIAAGWWFNSMALLADGWHMGSHVLAIGLSAFAYATSRRYARDPRFAFGTAKVEVLAGYTSAWLLLGMAVLMIVASVERMLGPRPVQYEEAMIVAAIGLAVNVACAWILGRAHDHHHEDHRRSSDHAAHDHGHAHPHDHHHGHEHGHHHDLNLRSAYLHVIADAATSVFAIVALAGGWMYGWMWLDPLMGIVGAILVAAWARKLISQTARVLLDREMDLPIVGTIREAAESGQHDAETTVTDLHVWRVGRNAHACAMTLVTHDRTLSASTVRAALASHPDIAHATIEIHYCPEADPAR